MKEILHMIVVLSLICGVSGFSLATLKQATRERIEGQVLTYVQGPALLAVVGEHDNDPIAERKVLGDDKQFVFPVIRDGELVGVALETFAPGYSGNIGVMVGFNLADDTLMGIGVTTQTETPGLGTRVMEPSFTGQFAAHSLGGLALKAQGGDIDGVSGATFSSVGTANAVANAAKVYESLKPAIIKAFKG
ncbi:RnfABCDGE type electron transport complex subunit G [Desulfovibrio ferrophilus]|uniref:Ion-translocating oxidoreductase complex subunit G n=1 Tax=Desulfovibrio ferrophilus TaxID=241368 RepID=A0A2Z6AVX3_9BACT|nr:FMN-binding protein [Desulfovibrio ferrophilus]BBD07381.1 electron transport complex, RnfABCDGE type, Gsub unit [Desulfovibrio ferrophilus]